MFDTSLRDSQSTAVTGIAPESFDLDRYAEYAAKQDAKVRKFMESDSGVLVYRRGVPVSITYTTVPTDGDREALYHTVLRYATADYDGADTQELNSILSEARL